MKAIDEARRINDTFPYTTPIQEWKATGGKVVGWMCTYVPEEIIHAAGLLPVRVTGDSTQLTLEQADAHLYVNTCSFTRTCMELGLTHQFDFLDGLIFAATCDGVRRLADAWRYYLSTPFVYTLLVPRASHEGAHQYYRHEVEAMKARLEDFSQVQITQDKLRHSVELYNRTRELLKALYELRKQAAPPFSGSELLEVLNAGGRMPREQFNSLLERLLEEAPQERRHYPGHTRLMIAGSILNNPQFISGIEQLGSVVVMDELCTSTRYWMDPVLPTADHDILGSITRRYLNNLPCARMEPSDDRISRILKLAREFQVQGVISPVIRFCSSYACEQPLLRHRLESAGIPVLELDVDYGTGITGQLKTRVEAFLEMVKGRHT